MTNLLTNRNYVTMILPLLGAIKIILDVLFGIKISDVEFNAIVDAVSSVFIVGGIVAAHVKKPSGLDGLHIPAPAPQDPQNPAAEQ